MLYCCALSSDVQRKWKVKMCCFCWTLRSTSELESFHNHILMYCAKRFCFTPPVYEARNLLAALDYNYHVHRPYKLKADGSPEYVKSTNPLGLGFSKLHCT